MYEYVGIRTHNVASIADQNLYVLNIVIIVVMIKYVMNCV